MSASLRNVIARPWFWLVVVALAFGVPAALAARRANHGDVPTLWQLPPWQLVDQDGRSIGSDALRGHLYIANFIFTSCVLECPRLTREMAHLMPWVRSTNGRVRLVSISVDPADDTPARLREYALRYHADTTLWAFVTGPTEPVLRAVNDGFRVGVEMPNRAGDGTFNPIELAHSNRFALVDGHGRLRAALEADGDGISEITRMANRLLADGEDRP